MINKLRILDFTLPTDTLRRFVRYCCRLTDATEVLSSVYGYPQEQSQAFHEVKRWVDGCFRNQLYQSCWLLSRDHDWHSRLEEAAGPLDPQDVIRYYLQLRVDERLQLRQRSQPGTLSDPEILSIVQSRQIKAYCHKLTWRKLRFILQNERSWQYQDLVAELQAEAVGIVRHYEVLNLEHKHLINMVYRGLTNYANNLAKRYGTDKRTPLKRLQTRPKTKQCWYCGDAVYEVVVRPEPKWRKGSEIEVEFPNGELCTVPLNRLFDSRDEALEGLNQRKAGQDPGRKVFIDLSADQQDDWQPTLVRFDPKVPREKFVPRQYMTYDPQPDDQWLKILNSRNDPKIRQYFDLLVAPDALFDQFCRDHWGKPAAELTTPSLHKAAKKYCEL